MAKTVKDSVVNVKKMNVTTLMDHVRVAAWTGIRETYVFKVSQFCFIILLYARVHYYSL